MVFGKFLIGKNCVDHKPLLLEIGGKDDSCVITEMNLSDKIDYHFETNGIKLDQLIAYHINHDYFSWRKFQ